MRLERHGTSEIRFALLGRRGGGKAILAGRRAKQVHTTLHTLSVGQFQEPPDSPMRLRDAPTPHGHSRAS